MVGRELSEEYILHKDTWSLSIKLFLFLIFYYLDLLSDNFINVYDAFWSRSSIVSFIYFPPPPTSMSSINPLPRFVSFCLVLRLTEFDQGWPCDHGSRTVCISSSDSSVKLIGRDTETMQELESRGVAECHLLGSTEPLYPWTQNYSTQNKIMIYSKLEHNIVIS